MTAILHPIQSTYLADASQYLFEAQQKMCSSISNNNAGKNGLVEAHEFMLFTITELEFTAWNPSLNNEVLRLVSNAFDTLLSQISAHIVQEEGIYSLQRTNPSTQQLRNATVVNVLVQLRNEIEMASKSNTMLNSCALLQWKTNVSSVLHDQLFAPLKGSLNREFESVLARMHRFKMDKPQNTASAVSNQSSASVYMLELGARIRFLGTKLLALYTNTHEVTKLVRDLAAHLCCVFLLHATMIRLHEEQDKFQIEHDINALDAALQNWLVSFMSTENNDVALSSCGEPYQALKNIQAVLFIPTDQLLNTKDITQKYYMPSLIWAQYIMTRSKTLPLPNEVCQMSKNAYVEKILHSEPSRTTMYSVAAEKSILEKIRTWIAQNDPESPKLNESADRDTLECLKAWLITLE